jgi:hypothetical protein
MLHVSIVSPAEAVLLPGWLAMANPSQLCMLRASQQHVSVQARSMSNHHDVT